MSRLRLRHAPDLIALTVLLSAIALLVWNRVAFDIWIARHDNLTAYLPWYTYLGERLRAGEVPGWNPYQFSGTPFAADPQSGWMYFPAMIPFTLFDPVTAIWVKLAVELTVAGLATYALSRVLGFTPVASLGAAAVFTFGPLSYQTAYCCTVRSHIAAWLPLTLLGAELAFRANTRIGRATAIAIGGFGFSQILAGWLGQGTLNCILIIGAWCMYRAFTAAPFSETIRTRRWNRSIGTGLLIGAAIGIFGAALNAAALIPRLVVNAETNLAGGQYDKLPSGYNYPPYKFAELIAALVNDDFVHRRMTIPAAGLLLALTAVVLVPRARSVPLFLGLTIATAWLALSAGPLYWALSLIPRWQDLHDHYPPQATATLAIGFAILTAAAIDALPSLAKSGRRRWLIAVPILLLTGVVIWLGSDELTSTGLTSPIVVLAITAVVLLALASVKSRQLSTAAQWLIVALILIEPTGLELIGSITRWDPVPGWEATWSPPADLAAATATYTSTDDLGGAGEFLQEQMALSGPFRYAGYGGVTYPGQKNGMRTYTGRRAEPEIAAMLVNGRSIFLHIYDMQGYNPIQLSRYTDYIRALNTVPQDYHLANLRPQGIGSPLLNALNVRFILVDARIPADRDDVIAIAQGRPPVFETPLVRVYENLAALPHAWIVHETITATRAEALDLLQNPRFNPSAVALVESDDVRTEPAASGAVDSATITRYDPERITITATAGSTGLLITSEIVESGWRATLDGQPIPVIPVNIALRGVEIPVGNHIIEFRYDPPTLRVGLIITVLTHGLLALLLIATGVNRRLAQTSGRLAAQRVR